MKLPPRKQFYIFILWCIFSLSSFWNYYFTPIFTYLANKCKDFRKTSLLTINEWLVQKNMKLINTKKKQRKANVSDLWCESLQTANFVFNETVISIILTFSSRLLLHFSWKLFKQRACEQKLYEVSHHTEENFVEPSQVIQCPITWNILPLLHISFLLS